MLKSLLRGGMAATEMAIASLADSMDVPRHHFVFYALFDMMVLATVYLCFGRAGYGPPIKVSSPSSAASPLRS